jgi:polyhydroxyalkanoate synthesis regulator phasin
MTANELADWIENNASYNQYETAKQSVIMLRQQAKEIEQLNFVLKNLVLATNKKINELEEEIEHLKNKVQYWKGLHR